MIKKSCYESRFENKVKLEPLWIRKQKAKSYQCRGKKK